MSSEPERVFSEANLTVSDQRNSPEGGTIEPLEYLKSCFRLEISTVEDLHAIDNDSGEDETIESLDYFWTSPGLYI